MNNMIGKDTDILNASLKLMDSALANTTYTKENKPASDGQLDGWKNLFNFKTKNGNIVIDLDDEDNVVEQ